MVIIVNTEEEFNEKIKPMIGSNNLSASINPDEDIVLWKHGKHTKVILGPFGVDGEGVTR